MASSLGNINAREIVNTNTSQLINQADYIVRSCKGPNCNTSRHTRTLITETLSKTAQSQAHETLRLLSISSSSVTGREIYNGYIQLASSVSSVYNYQCGNTTLNSTKCVSDSSSVQISQDNLHSLISPPSTNNLENIIVLSILLAIAVSSFILFLVFLIIAMIGSLYDTPPHNNVPLSINSQPTSPPYLNDIPIPVSPFDTTEPIYQ